MFAPRRWRPRARLVGVLAAALIVALSSACASQVPPPTPLVTESARASGTGTVIVFAASSLVEAFGDLKAGFEAATPGAQVVLSFGSSTQLRTQLEQGARADVFASADLSQMDAARGAGVLAGAETVFAANRLVLITPRDNPRGVHGVADLATNGVKLVTSQAGVPIGQYTLDMLDKAERDPAYGDGFRARVERNIVSREDNVRQVVSKVILGEADAAIVYATDATPRARESLQVLSISDTLNVLASYPIAPARGANPAAGQAFVAYVLSPAGQHVLDRWGFLPAPR